MGEVGNFLFGGSSKKESSENQSSNFSESENSSSSNSIQGSTNQASNSQVSGSSGYNQAYAPIASAMTPALGYTTAAGNMMAALLGVPQSSFKYAQTPYAPSSNLLPAAPTSSSSSSKDDLADILESLASAATPPPSTTPPTTPPPATPPGTTPPPATPPVTTPPSSGGPSPIYPTMNGGDLMINGGWVPPPKFTNNTPEPIRELALGGPVAAGEPVIVGENQPEVFVPQTAGTVLPNVPGSAAANATGKADYWRQYVMSKYGSGRGGPGTTPPSTPPALPPTTTTPPATTPATSSGPTANPTTAAAGLNAFSDSAGLGFVMDQGQKAISGASAANGVFNSGATGKALVEYGQGLGQTYLNQYMSHLASLGQLGLGAGSAMTGAGGVNTSQSAGGGSSSGASGGVSVGSSSGSSSAGGQSTGSSSGKGNSKNGLIPTILPG